MRRRTTGYASVIGALLLASSIALPAASAKTKTKGAFPITVANGNQSVHINARPARILSLSPSSTQMLYAIGAGRQVVGVDKYSIYPKNAPRTNFTGSESNAEDYLALRPDLVLLSFDTQHLSAQLQKLGIPTLLLGPPASIRGVESQIVELGRATGHLAGATKIVVSLNHTLAHTAQAAGGKGRSLSYYIEYDPTFYSGTSKTFAGQLFSRFGMKDVADPAGMLSSYPQLSAEYLVKKNPDFVFLADSVCCGQSRKTFGSRPGLSSLRAVRLGHVVVVNDSVASQWGPHSLTMFAALIERALTGNKRAG